MNIKINFFKEKFLDAIGPGIYEIKVIYYDKEETLYIGESIFVLVRCAIHLYELKKDSSYLGFTSKTIENENITLEFLLYKSESDMIKRKKEEKTYIKDKKPILQSGISDRMKSVEEKILDLNKFLDE